MNGEDVGRTAEDTGEVTLSAAEVKALASGNPLIEEQTKEEQRQCHQSDTRDPDHQGQLIVNDETVVDLKAQVGQNASAAKSGEQVAETEGEDRAVTDHKEHQ